MGKRIVTLICFLFFSAGMIFSAYQLFIFQEDYGQARNEYQMLQEYASTISNARREEPIVVDGPDLYLKSLNPDYIAWIQIPGTSINYPIVQNLRDPDYYLDHTFLRAENKCGSIFIGNNPDPFQDFNTVIFGHNMRDGSMFGKLKKYLKSDYLSQHDTIFIRQIGVTHSYKILAAYLIDEKNAFPYSISFSSEVDKQEFIASIAAKSNCPDHVDSNSQIITLSTCSGSSQRLIIQAKKE